MLALLLLGNITHKNQDHLDSVVLVGVVLLPDEKTTWYGGANN